MPFYTLLIYRYRIGERGKRVEWNTPIFLDSYELAFLGAPRLTEQQKLVLISKKKIQLLATEQFWV